MVTTKHRFIHPEKTVIPVVTVDYAGIYTEMEAESSEKAFSEFRLYLERAWFDLYVESLASLGYDDIGDLESYVWGSFTYSQNMTMDPVTDDLWWSLYRESPRIVAVHGHSEIVHAPRDHSRLRYHRNSLIREYGSSPREYPFDKGHYIGHKLGGQIDNGIFAQRRDVNRGWGEYRRFYQMERYAQANPGVFVFSRPIYGDGSVCPFYIEFGILKPDLTWWVEIFPNRYCFAKFQGYKAWPEWRRAQMKIV